jgi:hypothetical protein
LTTSTFDIMRLNQTIGRAEALRRTMLAYLGDRSDVWNGYPGFWGLILTRRGRCGPVKSGLQRAAGAQSLPVQSKPG